MPGLNQRQRVKINAALSLIYAHGYDAQSVVTWAREYQRKGMDLRASYQQALNEFIVGQPDLAPTITKVNRLIEHSDVPTVAKYEQAINAYIETGDDTAIDALGPMIAADSVALAQQLGEITGGVSAENVEAALGFAMAENHVQAAAQPAPTEPAREFAWNTSGRPQDTEAAASQVSPFGAGGRMRSTDQAKWAAAPFLGAGEARSLVQGHTLGSTGANPSQTI